MRIAHEYYDIKSDYLLGTYQTITAKTSFFWKLRICNAYFGGRKTM